MKIAILVTYLTGGGAEHVAALWAKGFEQQGKDVIVVMNTDVETVSYPLPLNVKILNIYKKECRIWKELGFGLVSRLRNILKTEKPDYIICVLPSWCQIAWRASRKLNISIIDTEHNAFERPKEAPMHWRERLQKFYFSRLADYTTVLTNSDYQIVKKKRSTVSVLPNPLTYEPVKVIPQKEKIILACGRLDVWYTKGFDLLIKSWGDIANHHDGWKLIIAGGGQEKNKKMLYKIAQDEGLTKRNFEMIGWCDDMLALYQKSAIFVLSSRFEGFGLALTEAMSQGCACIACDYNSRQADIISHKVDGILVPTDNVNVLSSSISKLIMDTDLRLLLQKNAIKRSYDFLLPNIMKKWDEIMKKI